MRINPGHAVWIALLLELLLGRAALVWAGVPEGEAVFQARDTFDPSPDAQSQARAVLEAVAWTPGEFTVRAAPGVEHDCDAVIRFPSPRPNGDPSLDEVVLLWYAARDDDGQAIEAPAVLVVHSLHGKLTPDKAIARMLVQHGLHAFIVQLPGYGLRRGPLDRSGYIVTFQHALQAIADVRRARDAITVLPNVQAGPVAIEGTSLGGFVASVVASLDRAFNPVLLALSGADCYQVLQQGQMDAQRVRERLQEFGYVGEKLRALLEPLEPANLVHRLDPQRTWVFTAVNDQVVPRASSDALAAAIGLEPDHRIFLPGDHYTCALALPQAVGMMARIIREGELTSQPTPPANQAASPTAQ
ncbi:MAG TPA: hypothetical protein VF184_04560 [Phycisphaeraceae bacterium]